MLPTSTSISLKFFLHLPLSELASNSIARLAAAITISFLSNQPSEHPFPHHITRKRVEGECQTHVPAQPPSYNALAPPQIAPNCIYFLATLRTHLVRHLDELAKC